MKRAGRKSRIKIRQEKITTPPTGQAGGAYKPLTDSQIKTILNAAFYILENIGMENTPEFLQNIAVKNGASVNEKNRLLFPKSMLEDIINNAAKKFTLYGRDKKHDFEVGGQNVYFGTGGAAVQTLDVDTHAYRASTIKDLHDFTRLVDKLENISWFTRCCVPTDITDVTDMDINTAYALIKNTNKHVGTSFSETKTVSMVVRMFDITLGGEGKFKQRPCCKVHISPIISPLRYGEDAVNVARECIKHNMPITAIVAAQSGATAPAPPAGMLAQSTAETIAALAMVNLMKKGYPMIFSNWPFVLDLRTGAFAGGGGEISILNAAAAQITNYLGLPSGVACAMTDAKALDAQMGAEKAFSALATGLAGANLIYESAGMTASLLGASLESFVIDNEMISHVNRIIQGIDVNDETIGIETIRKAAEGKDKHFLAAQQTMDAMERDYFYPELASREDPRSWQENGKIDVWGKANIKVKKILNEHKPNYIPKNADEEIRKQFRIYD